MSATDPVIEPTGVPEPASVAAPSPGIDPNEYQQLRQYADETYGFVSKARPHAERLQRYLDDENYRSFVDSATDSYERSQAALKPQISEETQAVLNEFKPVTEYVQGLKDRETQQAHQALEASKATNMSYAQKLIAERPDLAEDNYAGIYGLASLAGRDGVTLEDAWKKYGTRYTSPPPREAPPTSLRAAAAAPHIPGPSTESKARTGSQLRDRMVKNLREAGYNKGA